MADEVRTLGRLQVIRNGRSADELDTRPTCSAVLVYVATKRKIVRDSILALLWPDWSEARARHALNQTLYRLRSILGREWLPGRGQEVWLADTVRVDTADFASAVREQRFSEAVSLYGGPFLGAWRHRVAAPFGHWIDREAERLAGLFRTACRRGIAACVEADDRANARALAERWAEVEPDGAEAHRELIRLLVQDGKHASARECYRSFEIQLAGSGLVPGPEIREAIAPASAWRPSHSLAGRRRTEQPRIVVLPFAHTGPASCAHLTYGLANETTVRLSRHPGLAVVARSTAFTLGGQARSLPEIGAELQVDYVLDGALLWQAAGSSASAIVSPQLVRVRDGRQLRAFQLETDREGVANLHVRLADWTFSALDLPSLAVDVGTEVVETQHPRAYELYLRGLQHWHRRNAAGLEAAIDLFIRAIELHQTYARAYAGLALAYAMMPSFLGETPGAWMPRAKETAERALQLDPDSPEGHLAKGIITWTQDLDAAAAGRYWDRALALEPSNAQALVWQAYRSTARGRTDEARQRVAEALALDPLSVSTNFDAGMVLWHLRDQPRALAQMRRVLQLDPAFVPAAFMIGMHHMARGEIDDARREFARIRMFGPSWNTLIEKLDDPARALAAVDRIVEISPRPVHWYLVAHLYSLFGAPEQSLFWIEVHLRNLRGEPVAYPTGGPSLFHALLDPTFDALRSTSAFQTVLNAFTLDASTD